MTPQEMSEHGIVVRSYGFEDAPEIRVEWRGLGTWAVVDITRGENLTVDGEWEWEPSPSSRDQEFFKRCRFTLDDALRRAVAFLTKVPHPTPGRAA